MTRPLFAQPTTKWLITGGGATGTESSGSDKGTTIAVDDDGNTYITGYYNVDAVFGPFATGFSNPNSKEVFVCKIDTDGNYVWLVTGLNYYDDRGLGLCLDPSGNVFVTGTCWGSIYFNGVGDPNEAFWTDQIFVVKIDNNGNVQWVNTEGNRDGSVGFSYNENGLPQTLYQDDHGQDIVSDSQGNLFITGFMSNIDSSSHDAQFGTISVPLAPSDSVSYIAKITNDGVWQWVQTFDGEFKQRDQAIAIDDEDNIYVAGGYYGISTIGTTTHTTTQNTVVDYVIDPGGLSDTVWRNCIPNK